VPQVSTPVAGSKKSGWGETCDDDGGGGSAPLPRRRRAPEGEDEPVSGIRNKHDEDDDDGDNDAAPFIPDLEDEAEDMARQVAAAPSLKSSRVQTMKELDAEIDMALPSTSEIGVDLAVLQSFLSPQEQVQEEDVAWDPEKELRALASEMAREQEEREGEGEAAPSVVAPTAAPLRQRGAPSQSSPSKEES